MKRHAILVGLKRVNPDNYGGWTGEDGCLGCELDVDNMQRILTPRGYSFTVLKTVSATRGTILEALDKAASELAADDTLVFFFSGHGGQQADPSGDESDQRDETLIAFDGALIDDQLDGRWLGFKSEVRIVMLSDSCNSGSNYKGLRRLERSTPIRPLAPVIAKEMKAQMIHMGGCRDGSTSMGYQNGGAFTIALCEAWKGGSFRGNYKDFHTAICGCITGDQQPQYNEYGPVSAGFRSERPFSLGPLCASVLTPKGYAYFFHNDLYERYDFKSDCVDKIRRVGLDGWSGVWRDNLNASIMHPNGKAYFFRGHEYQRYDFGLDRVDKIARIGVDGWSGLWNSGLDAALLAPSGKAYFFHGDQYQRFDFAKDKVDKIGQIGENGWFGVWKTGLSGAVMHPNGKAYFFRGNEYQRYDFQSDHVDKQAVIGVDGWWGLEST